MRSLSASHFLVIGLVFALSPNIYGSELKSSESDREDIEFNCPEITREPSRFKELEKLSQEIDSSLCQSLLLSDNEISETKNLLLDFGENSKSILLKRFSNKSVQSAISTQFNHYSNEIINLKGDTENNNYPRLGVSFVDQSLYFSVPGRTKESKIADNSDLSCVTVTGNDQNQRPFNSCTQALNDAASAFNNYEVSVRRYRAAQNDPKLKYLNRTWDRYIDKARSQTLLDVWVTSAIHDDYYSQRKLVPPHPRQYFLFRPQIVYEINRETRKGDRNQVGLAVEWFGVNWWDSRIPVGVGLISVYADYIEEKSIGHGLQFTFYNSSSIGWVDRGDNDGVFVTVDFLKIWQDKSSKLAQYKNDPWEWFRE